MRVVAVSADQRDRYDAAIAASPLADVMQSYGWGEVKRASGWQPLRLLVEDDDGRVRAACSILRTKPAKGIPALLYAPRGPVLDYGDTAALHALIGEVRRRAAGGFMLKCDPPIESRSEAAVSLEKAGFQRVRSGAFGGVQPTAVMVLDLSPGLDKVFEGFKSKWRYNIRLAERKGVTVREGSREDIQPFYDILLETARRDRFTVRARSYFEKLWDELAPRGMLKMFMADYGGAPIAGILLTAMGERVIYTYGASSNEHRNVMPNHLIQWTAIRWATDNGYRIYDFRGVSPMHDGRAVTEHIAGLNRFKEGFGARYVEYAGEFDLSLRPWWYTLWRKGAPTAMSLRRKIAGGAAEAD
ncbi:MAG TPA: peptidoglycan bridge formation glycyltransferase FemA/FemB family protein [Actinomycetota bacterium]|nr:peptidoglycan bridge formation glycyltransferase FemA/FemB family protein [Actinomycetota bacterium]